MVLISFCQWADCRLFTVLMINLMVSIGCVRGPGVPCEFYTKPESTLMDTEATRMEGYRRVFAELPKVHFVGKLIARNKGWIGKEHFHFALLASDASRLRLRGYRPPNVNIFDLTVLNDRMSVLLEQTGGLYRGPIPEEGSPFREFFGVEPWDLIPILTFGQLLRASNLPLKNENLVGEGRGEDLDGLVSYQLDGKSGLPESAVWKWNQSSIHVDYQGWDYFTDAAPDRYRSDPEMPRIVHMMPSRLKISSPDIPIQLKLKILEYHFGSPLTRQSFIIYNRYPPTNYRLDQLKEAFKP